MGLPDVGAEWTFSDRLAWEAGEIGDELHPEPDFDENGLPILFEEKGRRYWCDKEGNVTMNRTDAIDFMKEDGWNFDGASVIVDTAIEDGILLTEEKLKKLSEDYKDR